MKRLYFGFCLMISGSIGVAGALPLNTHAGESWVTAFMIIFMLGVLISVFEAYIFPFFSQKYQMKQHKDRNEIHKL